MQNVKKNVFFLIGRSSYSKNFEGDPIELSNKQMVKSLCPIFEKIGYESHDFLDNDDNKFLDSVSEKNNISTIIVFYSGLIKIIKSDLYLYLESNIESKDRDQKDNGISISKIINKILDNGITSNIIFILDVGKTGGGLNIDVGLWVSGLRLSKPNIFIGIDVEDKQFAQKISSSLELESNDIKNIRNVYVSDIFSKIIQRQERGKQCHSILIGNDIPIIERSLVRQLYNFNSSVKRITYLLRYLLVLHLENNSFIDFFDVYKFSKEIEHHYSVFKPNKIAFIRNRYNYCSTQKTNNEDFLKKSVIPLMNRLEDLKKKTNISEQERREKDGLEELLKELKLVVRDGEFKKILEGDKSLFSLSYTDYIVNVISF